MIKTFEKFTQKLNESFHKVDYIQAHDELIKECILYILDFVKSQGGEIELYEEERIKYFAKLEGYESHSDEDTKYFWFTKIKVKTIELHRISGGGSEERLYLLAEGDGNKYNSIKDEIPFTKNSIPTNMILWLSGLINHLRYDKISGKWKK